MPFPFTDLSAIKQRPALVLSPDRSNKVRPDLVVAAITSQIPTTLGDDEVLLSGNGLKETGLPKPSMIKLSKIFTIHSVPPEIQGEASKAYRLWKENPRHPSLRCHKLTGVFWYGDEVFG